VFANFFGQLDTGSLTYKQQIPIKGESYEKNNYTGNGFSDAGDIYWRMLGAVGRRWQRWWI
jgi:hypothetical protein